MNWKRVHQLTAALVFLVSLGVYLATVAPTASFWDCGEFIAIAYKLQVSHPPGAPFYMLIGRLFSMFSGPENAAYAVNLVSVVSSALTILLTHLVIVQLVERWQGGAKETWQHLAALAGGVVGSLAFAFSDAFWFNAVEAEVYAMSMFFTALVVWLMLRWSRLAREEEAATAGQERHPFGLQANRYLVVIAYLFGLAIGVHLLNVLALFFCALIFYWDEYDRDEHPATRRLWGLALTGAAASFVFVLMYKGIIQGFPQMAKATGSLALTMLVMVGGLAALIWYSHKRRWLAVNLLALALAMVFVGYTTYGVIFLRSQADPPIDENDPETVEAMVSYLMREQYGSTPLVSGKSYDNATGQVSQEKLFPRRWSDQSPYHTQVYSQYQSDADFFWGYQVGHMYWRYFLWQFMGKASDTQDAPAISGLGAMDGAAAQAAAVQTPSERKSRNVYYALPLLLGLVGMAYHFWRDWRRASAVLLFFLLTGIGIIVYLNQYPGQPRERDYSYVASFFAYALWIGIGAAGLVELVAHAVRQRGERTMALAGVPVALVALLAVPVLMAAQNYDDHDRSGNYAAPDYAWNMLQSTAPNAVLFTNGDNDTFPLWYLQEVEGVRQDVRVANLSLAQIGWYALQLKNQHSRTSAPLPITLSDEMLSNPEQFTAGLWQPSRLALPVPDDAALVRDSIVHPSDLAQVQRPLLWDLRGRPISEREAYLGPNDVLVKNIIETNATQGWKRPLYMAQTVGRDGRLDTGPFLQFEGQALRILPVPSNDPNAQAFGRVSPDVALARLRMFRFRGLTDSTVYYDENARLMLNNYRALYAHAAEGLTAAGRPQEAVALLDDLNAKMPFSVIAGDPRTWTYMARAYLAAGADAKATALARQAVPSAMASLSGTEGEEQRYAAALFQTLRAILLAGGDLQGAADLSARAATLLRDPSLQATPEALRPQVDTARAQLGLPPRGTRLDTQTARAASGAATTAPADMTAPAQR